MPNRETDDVRMASSLAAGALVQNLTTCIACLILAFTRSWSLTLVILASVPLLIFTQALSQRFAGPLLARSRQQSSRAATFVDRVQWFTTKTVAKTKCWSFLERCPGRSNELGIGHGTGIRRRVNFDPIQPAVTRRVSALSRAGGD